jgi:hypothetical protein
VVVSEAVEVETDQFWRNRTWATRLARKTTPPPTTFDNVEAIRISCGGEAWWVQDSLAQRNDGGSQRRPRGIVVVVGGVSAASIRHEPTRTGGVTALAAMAQRQVGTAFPLPETMGKGESNTCNDASESENESISCCGLEGEPACSESVKRPAGHSGDVDATHLRRAVAVAARGGRWGPSRSKSVWSAGD